MLSELITLALYYIEVLVIISKPLAILMSSTQILFQVLSTTPRAVSCTLSYTTSCLSPVVQENVTHGSLTHHIALYIIWHDLFLCDILPK